MICPKNKSGVPPLGASRRTWHNVMKNKANINYCVEQFHYLGNRYMQCVYSLQTQNHKSAAVKCRCCSWSRYDVREATEDEKTAVDVLHPYASFLICCCDLFYSQDQVHQHVHRGALPWLKESTIWLRRRRNNLTPREGKVYTGRSMCRSCASDIGTALAVAQEDVIRYF